MAVLILTLENSYSAQMLSSCLQLSLPPLWCLFLDLGVVDRRAGGMSTCDGTCVVHVHSMLVS